VATFPQLNIQVRQKSEKEISNNHHQKRKGWKKKKKEQKRCREEKEAKPTARKTFFKTNTQYLSQEDHSKELLRLHNRHMSSNPGIATRSTQFIL